MTRRFLQVVGLLALILLALGSVGALAAVRRKLSITIAEDPGPAARGPDRADVLAEDVAALRADVLALSEGLGQGLQQLHDALDQAARGRHVALAAEVEALGRDIAQLEATVAAAEQRDLQLAEWIERGQAELPGLAASPAAPPPALNGVQDADEPVVEQPARDEPPTARAAEDQGTTSFLSFRLPSQAFAFDRAQRFEVQASLSRVGFDAKSTLHDFSGVTSAVAGTLEACLARPSELCRGTLRVEARALDTSDEARDEAMREHLAVGDHPEITFEWTAFEPESVDAEAMTVRGTARGRMSVRGVTREFSMPVHVGVDASRRVSIEGEAQLDLRDYDVPVPSKLGVISMESQVQVWIALRLRAVGTIAAEDARGR